MRLFLFTHQLQALCEPPELICRVEQHALGSALFGDVVPTRDERAKGRVIEPVDAEAFDRSKASILVTAPEFRRCVAPGLLHDMQELSARSRFVIRVNEGCHVAPDYLGGLIAEYTPQGRTRPCDRAGRVQHDDDIRALFDEHTKALFAQVECRLRPFSFRDVREEDGEACLRRKDPVFVPAIMRCVVVFEVQRLLFAHDRLTRLLQRATDGIAELRPYVLAQQFFWAVSECGRGLLIHPRVAPLGVQCDEGIGYTLENCRTLCFEAQAVGDIADHALPSSVGQCLGDDLAPEHRAVLAQDAPVGDDALPCVNAGASAYEQRHVLRRYEIA